MPQPDPVVFLLDVDNTLLDNDQIVDDLKRHMTQAFGVERQQRYWTIFEELRAEVGYADYLGALQRYRAENPRDPHFLQISFYLLAYPFADRLFPAALDVIAADQVLGAGGHPVRRRCHLPAPEGRALRAVPGRRGPCLDLHP